MMKYTTSDYNELYYIRLWWDMLHQTIMSYTTSDYDEIYYIRLWWDILHQTMMRYATSDYDEIYYIRLWWDMLIISYDILAGGKYQQNKFTIPGWTYQWYYCLIMIVELYQ